MAKKKLELPPALQTRASNRGRVVGAPDMPRPKRSHEEVLEEEQKQEEAATAAKAKQQAAIERVAAIEERSGEGESTMAAKPPPRPRPVGTTKRKAASDVDDQAEGELEDAYQAETTGSRPLTLRLRMLSYHAKAPPADTQSSNEG